MWRVSRIFRKRELPRFRRPMGHCRRMCRFRTTRLHCARWMPTPSILSQSPCVPMNIEKFGAFSAARGLPLLEGRSAFGWMGEAHGKMEFGRIFARRVALRSSFRERVRTLGFLHAEMGLRGASINVRQLLVAFLASTLSELQWLPSTLPTARGYSAWQVVLNSNPAGIFGWGADDEDLVSAQDTLLSGRFVQRWRLRMIAQEASLKEVANSKPR